jgi:hypothetical protein
LTDQRWNFWADWRHWVLGVEVNSGEIAVRLVWFTVIFQRRNA